MPQWKKAAAEAPSASSRRFELLRDGFGGGVLIARKWLSGEVTGKWRVAVPESSDMARGGYARFSPDLFPQGLPTNLQLHPPVAMCARRGGLLVVHDGRNDVTELGPVGAMGDAPRRARAMAEA